MVREAITDQREALKAQIVALLPDRAPGLSASAIYSQIATWSPSYIGNILRRLEREQRLCSACVPAARRTAALRRQFWRKLAP